MGGDGGSIASRADMVKTKGYRFLRNLGGMGYVPNTQVREGDERLRRSEARDLQLSTCSLSQEPLRTPVVACRLGRLYNKEELLSRLLSKSMPPHLQHISSLKDVQQCNVELNRETHFLVCPVSRVDIRSGIKASIIWPCGCVVADKARRVAATAAANAAATAAEKTGPSTASSGSNGAEERNAQNGSEPGRDSPPTPVAANAGVPDGEIPCINCGKPYDPAEDLVPLLPDEEELEKLQEKVKKLAEAKHAAKQAKKARAANSLPENGVGGSLSSSMDSCAGSSSGGSAGGSSSSVRSSSSDSSSSSGSSSRSSSGGIGGIDVKHNTGSSASATADGRNTSSSSSGSSSSAVKSGSASKSGGLHPAAVAPCATSTRLQADSFAWMRKEREEKQRKRKQRDWVLSSGGAVDEIVGTVMAPRAVRAGEHAASRT